MSTSSDTKKILEEKVHFLTARLEYYHSISRKELYEMKIEECDREMAVIQARKDQLKKHHEEAPQKVYSITIALLQAKNLLSNSDQVAKVLRMRKQIDELEKLEKEQRASYEAKQKRQGCNTSST